MTPGMVDVAHMAILILMAVSGFYAVWFRDVLSSIISLSILSLLLSIEFFLLQAPDVAIAEAAIGAGLSTAIYIVAMRACQRGLEPRKGGRP